MVYNIINLGMIITLLLNMYKCAFTLYMLHTLYIFTIPILSYCIFIHLMAEHSVHHYAELDVTPLPPDQLAGGTRDAP